MAQTFIFMARNKHIHLSVFIVEQADGISYTRSERILGFQPQGPYQSLLWILGFKSEVEKSWRITNYKFNAG